MMVQRLSVISSKGGAGKTTVAILLAGEYALRGKRVLLIDADNRQNLSEWWKLSRTRTMCPPISISSQRLDTKGCRAGPLQDGA